MRARFSRRGLMRGAVIAGGGAVFAGLGQGFASAQATKIAQSVARYQTTPKAKAQCDNCSSFISPASCKLVAGTVRLSGCCSLYSAKV